MNTFQIQNSDGTLSSVSRKEFYEVLRGNNGYLCYKQGGCHIAMLPTAENEETIRLCRQADNAENRAFEFDSRCLDEKKRICRYQHDASGHVIRNENGNPVYAKCGDCPRDGWVGGKRENCCIRNFCKVVDCACCTRHREYRAPLSLERFVGNNFNENDYTEAGYVLADSDANIQAALELDELNAELHTAISRLPLDERNVLKAVFWDKLPYRAYAAQSSMSKSAVHRLYNRALESLKKSLKDFF